MESVRKKIEESAAFILSKYPRKPRLAIVFGSGLSSESLIDECHARISYSDIPHVGRSTVKNHKGQLVIGSRKGKLIYIFSGRLHYYEGYSAFQITYPVRIMKHCGVEHLILTNAAGGVNTDFRSGDIMLIKDHINLFPDHPLRGPNDEELGPRFPDMLNAYDPEFRKQIERISDEMAIPVQKGVYLASQGPSLETPAEYTMMYRMGADAVGMSTVLETIVAVHSGIRVGGFSMISNECYHPERIQVTSEQDVIDAVKRSEPQLMTLLGEWIDRHL